MLAECVKHIRDRPHFLRLVGYSRILVARVGGVVTDEVFDNEGL